MKNMQAVYRDQVSHNWTWINYILGLSSDLLNFELNWKPQPKIYTRHLNNSVSWF